MPENKRQKDWTMGLVLFAVTVALYWPATSLPFVDYDDYLYIYQNPEVMKGLTGEGIKYAFTTVVAGNWHPLTVLAHMADCSMFGQAAGWHHLANIFFHGLNTVLVWILLMRLTGFFWPSAVAAALFGWHPLNVESVAWVSELKNVLSTFFFLLTLLAYLRYVEKPGPARYILTLVLYALGLLAKPMLVTLPCVLLLLDYWPLRRIFPARDSKKSAPRLLSVVGEKAPFFLLAAADSVVTYWVQTSGGAIVSLAESPLAFRLLNIPVAYVMYLEKTVWPSNLCILYPFPEQLPVVPALICLTLLVAGTVAVWRWSSQYRWLAVGWLWFLGTLVPVIGIVQFGAQSWADRYAYLPLLGIFLIIGCGLNELWKTRASWRGFMVVACGIFLGVCLVLTWQQINYWNGGVALFSRAVALHPSDAKAQDLLGVAYNDAGEYDQAEAHFAVAARLHPRNADFQYNLGRALMDEQRFAEATEPLAAAVALKTDNETWRNTLAADFMMSGEPHEAEKILSQAIAQQPQFSMSYYNLGIVQLNEQEATSAITNFLMAVKLQPDWPEAQARLAGAYAAVGDFSNAVSSASLALTQAQANQETELAGQISAELNSFQASYHQQSQH